MNIMALTEIFLIIGLLLLIVNIFISASKRPNLNTDDLKLEMTKINFDIPKIDP